MKIIFAFACLLTVLASHPVHAQTKAPLDPATRAAAQELMEASQVPQMLAAALQNMRRNISGILQEGVTTVIERDQKLSPAQRTEAMARASRKLSVSVAEFEVQLADGSLLTQMSNSVVPLYAKHFTVAEMKQIAAFYRSPAGVKFIKVQPLLRDDVDEATHNAVAPNVEAAIMKLVQGK